MPKTSLRRTKTNLRRAKMAVRRAKTGRRRAKTTLRPGKTNLRRVKTKNRVAATKMKQFFQGSSTTQLLIVRPTLIPSSLSPQRECGERHTTRMKIRGSVVS